MGSKASFHVRDGAAGPARVGIVMGSDSDLPVMAECCRVLDELEVPYEVHVMSAHRTPHEAGEFAKGAAARGLGVIVAGAGGAAHLAGAMAAHCTLPIIAVPIDATSLQGWDALLSSVQMPKGVPVACVAVGKMGAGNAGFLAAQILATADPALRERVAADRATRGRAVLKADDGVPAKLRELLAN